MEPTPQLFVQHLVEIFREAGRVLRDDGLLFVNLADSFAANRTYQVNGTKQTAASQPAVGSRVPAGLRRKSLIGIPWRFALAMMDEGWILRSSIIWAKGVSFNSAWSGSVMPESVQDRFTKSHEEIFMFAKQERYFFDMEAVREPAQNWGVRNRNNFRNGTTDPALKHRGLADANCEATGRQPRTVWAIGTKPSREKHYATFPSKLVEVMVKCSSSERGVCPACGAPHRRMVKHTSMKIRRSGRAEAMGKFGRTQPSGTMVAPATTITTGWKPGCGCNAGEPVPAVVCDPFAGTSTTGVAALKLGRSFVGLELSPEYCTISERRLRQIDAWQPAML